MARGESESGLVSDLFRGFVVPLAPLVIGSIFVGPGKSSGMGAGAWGVWLFLVRDASLPALVRIAYRGKWWRLVLFPLSMADRETCLAWLYAISWGWLALGIFITALGLAQMLSTS